MGIVEVTGARVNDAAYLELPSRYRRNARMHNFVIIIFMADSTMCAFSSM